MNKLKQPQRFKKELYFYGASYRVCGGKSRLRKQILRASAYKRQKNAVVRHQLSPAIEDLSHRQRTIRAEVLPNTSVRKHSSHIFDTNPSHTAPSPVTSPIHNPSTAPVPPTAPRQAPTAAGTHRNRAAPALRIAHSSAGAHSRAHRDLQHR